MNRHVYRFVGTLLVGLTASYASADIFSTPGGGLFTYNVANSGTYFIEAAGAQGGDSVSSTGGSGAVVGGYVTLYAGEELAIVVGGQGSTGALIYPGNDLNQTGTTDYGYAGGGGGGGSFVYFTTDGTDPSGTDPLIVAGGGGGAGGGATANFTLNGDTTGGSGQLGGAGGSGGGPPASDANCSSGLLPSGAGAGGGTGPGNPLGSGGGGGTSCGVGGSGGGGGGWASNGGSEGPATSDDNAGGGGYGAPSFSAGNGVDNNAGGNGGGGGGGYPVCWYQGNTLEGCYGSGGGGGGYSGGGGGCGCDGAGGGGGGSYIDASFSSTDPYFPYTTFTNQAGANTGDGFVIIEQVPEPSSVILLLTELLAVACVAFVFRRRTARTNR